MQAFFLTSSARDLFCVYWSSEPLRTRAPGVLLLPPLVEEMNQVRSFHGRLARRLAASGFGVLECDLSATGDSAGEFVNASWSDWIEDVRAAYDWLAERSGRVHVVAVRSAALHLDRLGPDSSRPVGRACLVEPVLDGDSMLAEFLRIKVARSLFEERRETLVSLRAQLEAGATIEVAGYELSCTMYRDLRCARLRTESLATLEALRVISGRQGTDEDDAWWQAVSRVCADARRETVDRELRWSVDQPEVATWLLDVVHEQLSS